MPKQKIAGSMMNLEFSLEFMISMFSYATVHLSYQLVYQTYGWLSRKPRA